MRRAAALLVIVCSFGVGCATKSMWNRQLRRATVSVLVGDHDAARSDLALALSLAESPPRDDEMAAYTLARLAEVENLDENWSEAEVYLRRAIELNRARANFARHAMEANLLRLRWLLLEDARVEEAVAAQALLITSLAIDRWQWVQGLYRPERRMLDNAKQHGPVELSFARELAEAGHAELAVAAFARAKTLGQEFELVTEANAMLSLARSKALAAVGRQTEAEELRAEAEAVRARSDYVEAALLHRSSNFAIVARWTDDSMPLRIHIERPGSAVVLEPESAIHLVKEAARAWQDAAGTGRPSFRFVRSARDADIRVQWRHERTFRGPVGVCHYNARWEDDPLRGAKVTLISRMMGRYLSDELLLSIAIHELGHALGLLGHSTRKDDIMYRAVSRTPRSSPSERDLRTIRRLYGATPGQSYNP